MATKLRSLIPALATLSVLASGPADACANEHVFVSLWVFPPEATSSLFFWGAEDGGTASFTIRFFGGHDCPGAPVSAAYGAQDDSAVSPSDYALAPGRVSASSDYTPASEQAIPVSLVDDALPESAFETVKIALSDPRGGSLRFPFTAPFLVVDDDGLDRVALQPGPHELTESLPDQGVAVLRAGPALGATSVSYELTEGSARALEDYSGTTGQLSFQPGQRIGMIPIPVINDRRRETTETLTLSLTGDATVDGAASASVTILDNEEKDPPVSRLHHPRQGWTYRESDYRIREIHVFTEDLGPFGVEKAQLGLRMNLRERCRWWTGRRWREDGCQQQRWLTMEEVEPDFFLYRVRRPFPLSRGSLENFTAFSRAFDAAGNRERDEVRGRNANTFEIRRVRGRPGG